MKDVHGFNGTVDTGRPGDGEPSAVALRDERGGGGKKNE
jgi:hypothetical protein